MFKGKSNLPPIDEHEIKEVDDFTKLDRRPRCRSDKGEIALIIFSYIFTFVLGMVAMGEIIYASVT